VKPDTRSFYEQAVQHTIEHIARHLDGALDLRSLARGACLSPFHFHRVFRGMTGETPLELTRRLRLERAAARLAASDAPVTDIAFDAGYETHEAFTRAFRACYSTSPTGFRRRAHPRIELAAPCGIHYRPDGRVARFVPRDSGGTTMVVEIKDMPDQRVATVRHIGPYNQIPTAFERLNALAGPAGLLRPHTTMLALYHDDPDSVPQAELRSDAAIVVSGEAQLPEGLVEQRLSGGRYARTMHVGPYERLGDTWARFLGEWLPASGERMRESPSFEIYVNNPMTAPPEELVTDIYIALV
jgi:AraC family transcriptional regulator